ncbi:MAG: hypothetical protein OHK0029_39920 [Armatimonadaceae bacterium]
MISAYYPIVKFREDSESIIRSEVINPTVNSFFNHRNISYYLELPPEKIIHSSDFDRWEIPIDYFYDVLLSDFEKSDDITSYATYCICHDQSITPLFCDVTQVWYSYVSIGDYPIFYYIYVDLKEIQRVLNTYKLHPSYK